MRRAKDLLYGLGVMSIIALAVTIAIFILTRYNMFIIVIGVIVVAAILLAFIKRFFKNKIFFYLIGAIIALGLIESFVFFIFTLFIRIINQGFNMSLSADIALIPLLLLFLLLLFVIRNIVNRVEREKKLAIEPKVLRRTLKLLSATSFLSTIALLTYLGKIHILAYFNVDIIIFGIFIALLLILLYFEADMIMKLQAIQQARESQVIQDIMKTYKDEYVQINKAQSKIPLVESLITLGIFKLPDKNIAALFPKQKYIETLVAKDYYEKIVATESTKED